MGKFKSKDHQQEQMDFSPIPTGEYTMHLVKSERKESSTSGNYYLNCQFSVTKGKFAKRVIFEIINLKNSNEKAQSIAEGQLSALMEAIGVGTLNDKWDLTPLMNKEFKAKVSTQKSEGYDDRNKISMYVPISKAKATDDEPKEAGTGAGSTPWDDEGKKKKKKKKKKNKK